MSYVSRTLGAKERVLYLTGYHWFYWLGVTVLSAPFIYIAIAGLPSYNALDYILLMLSGAPFAYGVYLFVHGIALEVAVTNDRFVKKTGLVAITTEEVSLDKIEEVNVTESVLGRIFGYGNVKVHGTGAGSIDVKMVNSPVSLRRAIQTAREDVKVKGES